MRFRSGNAHAGTLAELATGKRSAPRRKGGPAPRLSDEQVLEARRMRENGCATVRQLLRHFGIPYTQTARTWMQALLGYSIRSSPSNPLDPKLL